MSEPCSPPIELGIFSARVLIRAPAGDGRSLTAYCQQRQADWEDHLRFRPIGAVRSDWWIVSASQRL